MPSGINPETGKSHRFKDRTGQRNGRLVFTRHLGQNKHKFSLWEAVCDCGKITVTSTPGKTKSCGCLQREIAAEKASARRMVESERASRRSASRSRMRRKRRNRPEVAMQERISRLYRHALTSVGGVKESPTLEALGFTVCELRRHIERQFTDGMGWHNMHEWELDHIIPSSSAVTIEDVVFLNQLANLRPMWAADNNAKRDKVEFLI